MKSRKRIVKLFLGLGAIYMAIFVACMTRGSYGPLQQPLPEGTILFTTGSIDNVYLVGLPSCKCTHLDLKQAKLNLHSEPEQHEPEITKVSGPRNGVLAILLRGWRYLGASEVDSKGFHEHQANGAEPRRSVPCLHAMAQKR